MHRFRNARAEPVRFPEEQQVLPVETEIYSANYATGVDGPIEAEATWVDSRRSEAGEHHDG